MITTAVACGMLTISMLVLATRSLGPWQAVRFHHLAQALIPLAGAGVFLGLSALTVSQLRSDGIELPCVSLRRATMLGLATFWSGMLRWQITGLDNREIGRRALAFFLVGLTMSVADAGWFLLFWVW